MNNKSVALVTVIIFIGLIVSMSIALFTLMTSQIRLANHQVNRAKALYATEAAMVEATERLRRGDSLPSTSDIDVDWHFLSGEQNPQGKNVTVDYDDTGSGPLGSNELNLTIEDYSR